MSTRPSPPLRPLIVGLGDAGLPPHVAVLQRLRTSGDDRVSALFASLPPVGYDPKRYDLDDDADLERVDSLARATEVMYPGNTVAHVCTPPGERARAIQELVDRGFRLMVLDGPLAADPESMQEILGLVSRYRLRVGVVAPWLSSGITQRVAAAVADGRFGRIRRILLRHNVPRLSATLAAAAAGTTRMTAFDVEPPGGIALALALAGDGEVVAATLDNTPIVDGRWAPDMGAATLTIRHRSGVLTELSTDLAAPTWEQSITVEFDQGTVECHFPLNEETDHAHIYWRPQRGQVRREVFTDDAMYQGILNVYQSFISQDWPEPNLGLHARVVQLIADAKNHARRPQVQQAPAATQIAARPAEQPVSAPPSRPLPPIMSPQDRPALPANDRSGAPERYLAAQDRSEAYIPPEERTGPRMPPVTDRTPAPTTVDRRPPFPPATERGRHAPPDTDSWSPRSRVLHTASYEN